jgi:hypothetical protein
MLDSFWHRVLGGNRIGAGRSDSRKLAGSSHYADWQNRTVLPDRGEVGRITGSFGCGTPGEKNRKDVKAKTEKGSHDASDVTWARNSRRFTLEAKFGKGVSRYAEKQERWSGCSLR